MLHPLQRAYPLYLASYKVQAAPVTFTAILLYMLSAHSQPARIHSILVTKLIAFFVLTSCCVSTQIKSLASSAFVIRLAFYWPSLSQRCFDTLQK